MLPLLNDDVLVFGSPFCSGECSVSYDFNRSIIHGLVKLVDSIYLFTGYEDERKFIGK